MPKDNLVFHFITGFLTRRKTGAHSNADRSRSGSESTYMTESGSLQSVTTHPSSVTSASVPGDPPSVLEHARERTTFSAEESVQLVVRLARSLYNQGCFHYSIMCGYRVPEKRWKLFIHFGESGLTKEVKSRIREEVLWDLAIVVDDRAVKGLRDFPVSDYVHWQESGLFKWKHMTQLHIFDGIPFLAMKNGKEDILHGNALAIAAGNSHARGGIARSFVKIISKISIPKERRRVLGLDEVLDKLAMPQRRVG